MLDAVAVAMLAILIALFFTIGLAKRQRFQLHKRLQTIISILLLIAVVVFELEMRFFTDWRELAKPSRFYESGIVDISLAIHLLFAIPTPFVWGAVLILALRRFPKPPIPDDHSRIHRRWAWVAVGMMTMTAITGWIFYLLAFVA